MSSDNPYPSYPGDGVPGSGEGVPPAAPEQPPSMRTAVTLMRVGAGVALVSVIYSVLTISSFEDDAKQEIAEGDPTLSAAQIDSLYTAAIATQVVFGLIAVGLWLLIAWANGRGRRWARKVATVLGALNVLASIVALTMGSTTAIAAILAVVNLLVGAAALWFLYQPDSTRFYDESSRPAY